jgi:hypothetical protein
LEAWLPSVVSSEAHFSGLFCESVAPIVTTKQENQLPSDPPGDEGNEGTERGDAILRRMLRTKPKPHKKVAEESKAKRSRSKNRAAS